MITYVVKEIKSAGVWTGELLRNLMRWLFRWLLRLGFIGLLVFGVGGGCRLIAGIFKNDQIETSVEEPAQLQEKKLPESFERSPVTYPYERPKPTMQTQVKSTWSVLNGIVRDVQRFLRRR